MKNAEIYDKGEEEARRALAKLLKVQYAEVPSLVALCQKAIEKAREDPYWARGAAFTLRLMANTLDPSKKEST